MQPPGFLRDFLFLELASWEIVRMGGCFYEVLDIQEIKKPLLLTGAINKRIKYIITHPIATNQSVSKKLAHQHIITLAN